MKGNFFKKLGIKITGFIGLTLLASGLGSITGHAAMDGVNYVDPEKIYDEANSLIISKNADIKNFSVETINATSEKKVNEKGSADIYRSFDKNYSSIRLTFGTNAKPTISKDSKIIVTQENVGSYSGKAINVKQTFSNFTLRSTYLGEESPYFEISGSPFSGYLFVGFPTFKYEVEFTYSDTGAKVSFPNGDAFLSFNSLNGATDPSVKLTNRFESVKYYNSDNKKDVYVTKDTNIGYGNPSKISVTSPDRASNTYNGDMYGGFSNDFTDYLGGATFAKNTVQFKLSGDTQSFQIGSNTGEAWNALSTATLFNVKVPSPTKTVEDDNGIDLDGEIVENGEVLNYKIHQKVNNLGVDILERYKSFVITDTLDKNVTYKSAFLTDGSGNEIKGSGTITHDSVNNKVTFTASKDFLEKMELNGNTYILQIQAIVNDSVKGGTVIKNVGKTTINNQNESTNEVQNPVVVPDPITPTKQVVNTSGQDINGQLVERNETLVYKVSQNTNTLGVDIKNRYTKFTMEDTLDKNVVYQSARVLDPTGKEVENAGTIAYDKTTNTVTFTGSKDFLATMELKGNAYTLEITTKVSNEVKNAVVIKNVGKVTVNNNSKNTNEVENKTAVPDPIDPTKTEKNDKGIDYNGKAVYAGDTLVFDVSQKVHKLGTDLKNPYSSFGLYDTLDNRLEYVSVTILKDGKEVKEAKDLSFDKEKNRVSFTADKDFLKAMEYKNETYTLRITTKVSTNIAEGETITNKAESLVNDTTRETNEVKNPIKVPKGSLEIAKVTNQLTGIKVSMNQNDEKTDKKVSALSSVFGITANAEETTDSSLDFNSDVSFSNDFIYDKKPQGGVTYELLPNKDITYGNGELIHKEGTSLAKQTTDNNTGLAVFNDLYEGEYVLYERSAPVGIQVDPTPIYVTLKANEKQQEFTVEQGHEDPLQEVELKGTKEFEQEDGTFKAQAGATFGLYLNDEYTFDSNKTDDPDSSSTSESSTQATTETTESTQSEVKPLDESTTADSSVEESTTTSTTESSTSEEETSKTIPKDQLISEMKVNADGSLGYKGVLIPNQRYYVKEIETSEGYQLLQDKLTFIYQPVNNNAVADMTLYAEGYVTDGVYIPYKDVEALKLPVKDVLSKSEKYKEPTEDQKQPLKNILITENSIKKSIKKADGTLVDSYDVLEDKEKITFLGTATLGNSNNPDDSIVLEDNLPKGLTYESMKVFDEKQQDITSKVKIDTKDQKLTVTVNKEYAKTLKSTKLYWEVLTTYHASEDVAGKKLENEMILNVGDKKYNSKVTLQTPKLVTKEKGIFPQTGEEIASLVFKLTGSFIIIFTLLYWKRNEIRSFYRRKKRELMK